MSLDHLWAGWRATYVSSVMNDTSDETSDGDQCVFCRILSSGASDEERFIVHHGKAVVVMLNAFPYASGHMLVMPTRHVDDIALLTQDESTELWEMTRQAVATAKAAYGPDGVNIGANLGRAAGAGIPAHLHLHIVPRWIGDTNFMTAVASVRVMPESLDATWRKLSASWSK